MNARLALTSLAFALSLCLALPALAVEPPTEPATRAAPASKAEKRLELLRANAGESVERVRFLRPMHGYEVVGPLELLVWETPFKAWLVTVRDSPACNRLANHCNNARPPSPTARTTAAQPPCSMNRRSRSAKLAAASGAGSMKIWR